MDAEPAGAQEAAGEIASGLGPRRLHEVRQRSEGRIEGILEEGEHHPLPGHGVEGVVTNQIYRCPMNALQRRPIATAIVIFSRKIVSHLGRADGRRRPYVLAARENFN